MLHQLFHCYIALHTTVAICSHQLCLTICRMLIAATDCRSCLSDLASNDLLARTSNITSMRLCEFKEITGFPSGHWAAQL